VGHAEICLQEVAGAGGEGFEVVFGLALLGGEFAQFLFEVLPGFEESAFVFDLVLQVCGGDPVVPFGGKVRLVLRQDADDVLDLVDLGDGGRVIGHAKGEKIVLSLNNGDFGVKFFLPPATCDLPPATCHLPLAT